MQAKDLPTERVLAAIRDLSTRPRMVDRWSLAEALPDVPEKVLMAKLRKMVKAGLITGCFCGCRGDFEIVKRAPARGIV